jgi:hypothetical protein
VEIARALDHFNVPEREKREVLAVIVARKDEVVILPRNRRRFRPGTTRLK